MTSMSEFQYEKIKISGFSGQKKLIQWFSVQQKIKNQWFSEQKKIKSAVFNTIFILKSYGIRGPARGLLRKKKKKRMLANQFSCTIIIIFKIQNKIIKLEIK